VTGAFIPSKPESFGGRQTVARVPRHRPTRAALFRRASQQAGSEEPRIACVDGDLQKVDSSSIRVHQHAANVKKTQNAAVLHKPGTGARCGPTFATISVHSVGDE
jgi:hypothetical protein